MVIVGTAAPLQTPLVVWVVNVDVELQPACHHRREITGIYVNRADPFCQTAALEEVHGSVKRSSVGIGDQHGEQIKPARHNLAVKAPFHLLHLERRHRDSGEKQKTNPPGAFHANATYISTKSKSCLRHAMHDREFFPELNFKFARDIGRRWLNIYGEPTT